MMMLCPWLGIKCARFYTELLSLSGLGWFIQASSRILWSQDFFEIVEQLRQNCRMTNSLSRLKKKICWHQVPPSIPYITILSFFPTMNHQERRKRWWDKKEKVGLMKHEDWCFHLWKEAGYHWHTSFFQVPFNLDPLLLFIYPLHSLRDPSICWKVPLLFIYRLHS